MVEIMHQLIIEVSPDKVFSALTEENGLASWWTTRARAEPRVGAIDEFGFLGGQVITRIEVTGLEPAKKVSWKPVESTLTDWNGTEITWDLLPVENGTRLLFAHRNYPGDLVSFAPYNYNWAIHLTSLKAYLETGKGTPKS